MASFRKLASGRWQAVIRKRGHKPLYHTCRTLAAAKAWARDAEDTMSTGQRPADVTMRELFDWYEHRFTPSKKSAGKEISRLRLLGARLGAYTLERLTADVIVMDAEERLSDVLSDTVRKELGTLAVVIDAAIALKGIRATNPVPIAKTILRVSRTLKPGTARDRRLTPEEVEKLAQVPLWAFMLETGMRRGEVAAMRRQHRTGSTLHIPETKTDKARTIPLSRRALEILASVPARLDGSVWGMRPDSITHAFRRDCARLGIEGLRLHDLRHEATSRLFEAGLSIPEVAAITGHADWSSLKRYTRLCPERLSEKLG